MRGARRLSAVISAAASTVALMGASGRAEAVEREHHLGLDPQLAMLKVDDKSTLSVGGGLGVHYTYGLTDQLLLMGELAADVVAADQKQDTPQTPHTRPAEVDHATGGIGYVLDILQFVPYGGVLVGGYRLAGGTLDSALVLPGAEVALGLDYLVTRHFAVGVAGQEHFLVTKMSTYPVLTMALLRAEYVWGF